MELCEETSQRGTVRQVIFDIGMIGLRSSEVRSNRFWPGNYSLTLSRDLIFISMKCIHAICINARVPSRNFNCACDLQTISQLKLPRWSQGISRRFRT